jgi:hypothetical protein
MERCGKALLISLLLVSPAIAGGPSPWDWKICLEQNTRFRQLSNVEADLGPLLTLPERVGHIIPLLREVFFRLDTSKPVEQQLSAEQRQMFKLVQHWNILADNCSMWSALRGVAESLRLILPTQRETWQACLEQQPLPSQLRIFHDPEQWLRRATALQSTLEEFDPTQPYAERMSTEDKQLFKDIDHDSSLIQDFWRCLKERH